DEVLAVGDAQFQKKCLGKMGEVAKGGRTVLFVSHNMATVQTLCKLGILLQNGQVVTSGPTAQVVSAYLRSIDRASSGDLAKRKDRGGSGGARLCGAEVLTDGDVPSSTLAAGLDARFRFRVSTMFPGMACVFTIYDSQGLPVASFNSAVHSVCDKIDPAL